MEADDEIMRLAGLAAQQAAKPGVFVRFSLVPVENEAKTKEAGYHVIEEEEFIEIRVPGSQDFVHRPIRPSDKEAYPAQYVAWKKNQAEPLTGTPLSMWAAMRGNQVKEAEYLSIRTIEELAQLADVNLQKLGPGWVDLRQKARDYLKAAKDGSVLVKMRDELKERDEKLETLTRMFEEQKKSIEQMRKQLSK